MVLLALAPLVWCCWRLGGLLEPMGEAAAMLSAALIMPDGSAPILRERFRAEIYNPDGGHATGENEQGVPLPQDEAGDESAASRQADDDAPDGEDLSPSTSGPRIPEDYAAPIINENFASREGGLIFRYGDGLIKNESTREQETLEAILETGWDTRLEEIDEPQVLIVHTHATEAFEKYDSATYDIRNTWRSTDNHSNMVAVGDAMTQVLEERGIGVLHDTTQHDYPSYNGSYERSAETINRYLEEYPTIQIVLDLHRDAMQRDDAIVKPVAVIDGKKAAQIMIIAACDDDGADVPDWEENFRFAAQLQNHMERAAPGLTRPIYLCYRKYNMDLTTGSLLLEFGSNANTLEEAVYSAQLAGQALADLIGENIAQAVQTEQQPEENPAAETDAEPSNEPEGE